MPEFKNKQDAEKKLKAARLRLKKARENKDDAATQKALADCVAIQNVLDKYYN